jgi:hypothetical protein
MEQQDIIKIATMYNFSTSIVALKKQMKFTDEMIYNLVKNTLKGCESNKDIKEEVLI